MTAPAEAVPPTSPARAVAMAASAAAGIGGGSPRSGAQAAWARFATNRSARLGLALLVALYALACFAPLICNQKPFFWRTTGPHGAIATEFPLVRDFFHPETVVDFVFNAMAAAWVMAGAGWLLGRVLQRRRLPWALAVAAVAAMCIYAGCTRHYMDQADYYSDHLTLLQTDPAHRALFSPVAYGPIDQILSEKLEPPSWWRSSEKADPRDARIRWLGTDANGRDLFARLLHGTRISLSVGLVAVAISLIIGLFFGALAGFYAGWIDVAISRFIELVICFPVFFLIMLVLAVVRDPGIFWIMLILGLTGWPRIARLVRGEFLKLRNLEFVAAARALGLPDREIMLRHILPNALGPVYVAVSFAVAGAVLLETGLSFLGIGVQPPTPSWGEALNQAANHIEVAWWLATFPGIAILLLVLAFNLVGDGLRDAFDPRLRAGGE